MHSIAEQLQQLKEEIGPRVKLVAVSKYKPVSAILEAYEAGHRLFGENRVQELVEKQAQLPEDIAWHVIGHLQRNKVKYIAPFVSMIHSVDSLKLLRTINQEGAKVGRVIDCLLQVFIAKEDTKFGLAPHEIKELLDNPDLKTFNNVRICGLMGMATNTSEQAQVSQEFASLKQLFTELQTTHFSTADYFKELSMGMTGDYLLAIQEGSTLIRVGSRIFGARS